MSKLKVKDATSLKSKLGAMMNYRGNKKSMTTAVDTQDQNDFQYTSANNSEHYIASNASMTTPNQSQMVIQRSKAV